MATPSFILFALIVLIISNETNPKSKSQIWSYSIFIPLAMLLAATIMMGGSSKFAMGMIAGECTISTIFSMWLMYYRLNKKFKNQTQEVESPQEK